MRERESEAGRGMHTSSPQRLQSQHTTSTHSVKKPSATHRSSLTVSAAKCKRGAQNSRSSASVKTPAALCIYMMFLCVVVVVVGIGVGRHAQQSGNRHLRVHTHTPYPCPQNPPAHRCTRVFRTLTRSPPVLHPPRPPPAQTQCADPADRTKGTCLSAAPPT